MKTSSVLKYTCMFCIVKRDSKLEENWGIKGFHGWLKSLSSLSWLADILELSKMLIILVA